MKIWTFANGAKQNSFDKLINHWSLVISDYDFFFRVFL